MVGKLNDMFTAAVVVDSSLKVKSTNTAPTAQTTETATNVKTIESRPISSNGIKDAQTTYDEKKQEELKERLKPGTMSEESVSQMTETFNKLMSKINCNLEFNYNREADILNVKMIDKETKEVIKEFPPEEMIENMIKAKDWLGAFIDKAV
ncbi:MAG: flagellar protein FlaG [Selenomonadaceae bacterium]|nr:flagellar protein FlaG [Selenomonadaceae bacterium]